MFEIINQGLLSRRLVKSVVTGDTVLVHYTVMLEDGTEYDSTYETQPMKFTLGAGQVIKSMENAVLGMVPGETKTIHFNADQAYGPHREELVMELDRGQMPEGVELVIGEQLQIRLSEDELTTVTIKDVSDNTVTMDANHPLAGKDLIFEIRLVGLT